jgi:hypothetical protein
VDHRLSGHHSSEKTPVNLPEIISNTTTQQRVQLVSVTEFMNQTVPIHHYTFVNILFKDAISTSEVK